MTFWKIKVQQIYLQQPEGKISTTSLCDEEEGFEICTIV